MYRIKTTELKNNKSWIRDNKFKTKRQAEKTIKVMEELYPDLKYDFLHEIINDVK